DKEIGYAPKQVFMYGAVYTQQEFARSVCRDDEYTALTSFTHHPFFERFPLEVPEIYFVDTFLNVPLDTMMQRIER
ncbi:UNVERIFIED_CONTAM: cysteine protease, partial [Prevotella sp. 15_C9]